MTTKIIIGGEEIIAEYWIGSKESGGIRFLPTSYGINIDIFRKGEDCPVKTFSIALEEIDEFVGTLNQIKEEYYKKWESIRRRKKNEILH